MALVTTGRLQREFGMSFTTASALINDQRALASRRHRALLTGMIACDGVLLASYVLALHWAVRLVQAILLIALLLGALHLYLTRRDSCAPILAAARIWRDERLRTHK